MYDPNAVNLLSPLVRQDPYPYFAHLRTRSPVLWDESLNAFLIAGYKDVVRIARDTTTFSSIAMRRQATDKKVDDRGGNSVITSDPPEHTRLRNILQDEFRMRPLRELKPRVEELVAALMNDLGTTATFDLVERFTIPLPVTVIAELLDIAPERHADFKHWSDCLIKLLNDRSGPAWEAARAGVTDLINFFVNEFDERSNAFEHRHDILSVLLKAEAAAEIDRREMVAYSILLLTGGNETTTNLIGGMVLALLQHPDQLSALRADPARIPNAIEEGLRYCSPVQGVYRRAMREVEIGGVDVPVGSDLILLLASANHDPAKFDHPERFDIGRHTGGHTGFGLGVHHCLGAHLGRLEARAAFEQLLPLLDRVEPRFKQVAWNDNWFVRGPERLPFAWR